jgi:predicted nucleic acid-binding protein
MIVVSDTTAISTLLQMGEIELLEKLFSNIVIPQKVFDELLVLSRMGVDVSLLLKAEWLEIRSPGNSPLLSLLNNLLDEGEANAIALAVELKSDLLIMDESEGRQVAGSMNLTYTGLGGVFIRAKAAGLIPSVKKMLDTVAQKTSFYLSEKARTIILRAAGEAS